MGKLYMGMMCPHKVYVFWKGKIEYSEYSHGTNYKKREGILKFLAKIKSIIYFNL